MLISAVKIGPAAEGDLKVGDKTALVSYSDSLVIEEILEVDRSRPGRHQRDYPVPERYLCKTSEDMPEGLIFSMGVAGACTDYQLVSQVGQTAYWLSAAAEKCGPGL